MKAWIIGAVAAVFFMGTFVPVQASTLDSQCLKQCREEAEETSKVCTLSVIKECVAECQTQPDVPAFYNGVEIQGLITKDGIWQSPVEVGCNMCEEDLKEGQLGVAGLTCATATGGDNQNFCTDLLNAPPPRALIQFVDMEIFLKDFPPIGISPCFNIENATTIAGTIPCIQSTTIPGGLGCKENRRALWQAQGCASFFGCCSAPDGGYCRAPSTFDNITGNLKY